MDVDLVELFRDRVNLDTCVKLLKCRVPSLSAEGKIFSPLDFCSFSPL